MQQLPVPYLSQWQENANHFRTDCGVADVAMLLSYTGKLRKQTINSLAMETTLPIGDVGLMPNQLVTLAAKHGLSLYRHDNTTLDDLYQEIDARHPVIVLVAYRFVLGRRDQKDNNPLNDGHFFLAVGYNKSTIGTKNVVIVHDPDYYSIGKKNDTFGAYVEIPVDQMIRAMAAQKNVCIFMKENQTMSVGEQIKAIATQIQILAQQAGVYADQVVDTAPSQEPIPDGSILVKAATSVNIRIGPATSGPTIGDGFSAGDEIVVEAKSTIGSNYTRNGVTSNKWRKITARVGKGGYVAELYLVF